MLILHKFFGTVALATNLKICFPARSDDQSGGVLTTKHLSSSSLKNFEQLHYEKIEKVELIGRIERRKIYYLQIRNNWEWKKYLPKKDWVAFTIADKEDEKLVPSMVKTCFDKMYLILAAQEILPR